MFQTVMIVDDSMPLHALIKAQFQADHLDFHSVYDGAAAVSLAVALQPDLILLDVDMPDMDGFEACRRIKADPETASIPLMFLTADSLPADKQRAMEMGAFDYIQKPFNPTQLRTRVRSKLEDAQVYSDKSKVDLLTGLRNKSQFDLELREQFVLAQLAGKPMACVVAEIDQLGSINVRYGPKVANQVVRKVANVISSSGGMYSTTCCLPNRRFASLLRHNDRFAAADQAERLRRRLDQKLLIDGKIELDITCSFGVCDNQISTAMTLFDRADRVLDRAADRGGNCVAVARAGNRIQN